MVDGVLLDARKIMKLWFRSWPLKPANSIWRLQLEITIFTPCRLNPGRWSSPKIKYLQAVLLLTSWHVVFLLIPDTHFCCPKIQKGISTPDTVFAMFCIIFHCGLQNCFHPLSYLQLLTWDSKLMCLRHKSHIFTLFWSVVFIPDSGWLVILS